MTYNGSLPIYHKESECLVYLLEESCSTRHMLTRALPEAPFFWNFEIIKCFGRQVLHLFSVIHFSFVSFACREYIFISLFINNSINCMKGVKVYDDERPALNVTPQGCTLVTSFPKWVK